MSYLKKYWLLAPGIALVLCTFYLVYRPGLFNFFICDDFFFMAWLDRAIHHPEFLFAKYWELWSGYTTRIAPSDAPLFYRPLFNTMLFVEYLLWGANSICFRLVNMAIELLTGVMLGFMLMAINNRQPVQSYLSNKQSIAWAFLSAALFILFPIHSEPVNWISARMDLLVTLLSLFSIWCYIRWRSESKQIFFILSIASTILAFLSMEMAVALPPTIFIYELLFSEFANEKTINARSSFTIAKRLRYSIIATWPYWLTLFLYFCLRRALLGDVIAGYRVDLIQTFSIIGWLHGLEVIFVPINTFIIGSHSYIFKAWHVVLFVAIFLTTIASCKGNRHNVKIIVFLIIWFLLCLVPVCKVFPMVMSSAFGSRLAYMATAPVCALLTYGLAVFCVNNKFSLLIRCVALILLWLAATVLYSNNLAWAEAGHLTNKVVQEFKGYYQNTAGDPLTYVCGLPEFTKKGIIASTSVHCGMASKPIMDRDLYNCLCLDSHDQYNSIGFIKEAILHNQKTIVLLYWDSQSETLKPVTFFRENNSSEIWQGNGLKKILYVPLFHSISMPESHWLSDGTMEIVSNGKVGKYTIIEFNLAGLSCWKTDFLALQLQFSRLKDLGPFKGAELFFTNDIAKQYSNDYFALDHCHASLRSTVRDQEIIFSLRDLPAWSMGGKCHSIRIVLPADCCINIKKLRTPQVSEVMPLVHLQSYTDGYPGEIKLDKYNNVQHVRYDAHSINGCKQLVLEIAQPFKYIESLDSKGGKAILIKRIATSSCGEFIIHRMELPCGQAIYRARLRALDGEGNQVGFPSDYFFIVVGS